MLDHNSAEFVSNGPRIKSFKLTHQISVQTKLGLDCVICFPNNGKKTHYFHLLIGHQRANSRSNMVQNLKISRN